MTAVAFMAGLASVLTAVLVVAAQRYKPEPEKAVDEIEALLPHIQCGQCGYPGCRPYAHAMLAGAALPNLCPPGGQHTVARLSEKLGIQGRPLAESGFPSEPVVAKIDEDLCIGCALCLPACPFDAIIGAHRYSHTVVPAVCTGCGLCVEPCPVDCIALNSIEPSAYLTRPR